MATNFKPGDKVRFRASMHELHCFMMGNSERFDYSWPPFEGVHTVSAVLEEDAGDSGQTQRVDLEGWPQTMETHRFGGEWFVKVKEKKGK